MKCSIASRSSSNAGVNSGTVEWLRLYWFCYDIGTDASTIAARSALPKGIGVGYMAWKLICISLNSQMVVLMVLVQKNEIVQARVSNQTSLCLKNFGTKRTHSRIPGLKGEALFFD